MYLSYVNCLIVHSTGLHSTTTESTSEPAPKKMRSSLIDVSKLKTRYHGVLPQNTMSNTTKTFKQFYSELVGKLPMDDAVFVTNLYSNDLLPGNLRNQLNLQNRTSVDKATLFLDSVIEPSVTSDDGKSFNKLLNVMEDSEYDHLKELAKLIRTSLRERSSSDNG